jgi:hypothetical protein
MPFHPLWNFRQTNKNPQNDNFFFENSRTSKYQNKKPSKFTRRKANSPLQNFTQANKDPQNDKKKIENSETSKYQNKKPSKLTRWKANTPSPPWRKLHTNK